MPNITSIDAMKEQAAQNHMSIFTENPTRDDYLRLARLIQDAPEDQCHPVLNRNRDLVARNLSVMADNSSEERHVRAFQGLRLFLYAREAE